MGHSAGGHLALLYAYKSKIGGANGTVGFSILDMILTYEGDINVQGIEITALPTKTVYLEGEVFDPSDMVVTATYGGNSTGEVKNYMLTMENFDSDNLASSVRKTVTLNVNLGAFTASTQMNVAINKNEYTNLFYDAQSDSQKMDIHIPKNADGTYKAGPFSAVITIHGGGWCGGERGYYNYMTNFITDTCNCVHVNMDYRLTKENQQPTGFTYMHMLYDIQSAISYLQNHASTYHIHPNKIALMGHSAGGHLALLYAYKNPTQIDLVISEAGPTYFYKENEDLTGQDEIITDENICAMVGIDYKGENYVYQHKNEEHLNYQEDLEDITALWNASPLKYATSNAPYTILAYGNGLSAKYDNYEGNNGDDTIPYSQATSLMAELDPTFEDTSNGSETNASQVIEGENCTLFKLYEVGHNDFGTGTNNKKIYPTSNNPNSIMYFSGLQDAIEEHLKE